MVTELQCLLDHNNIPWRKTESQAKGDPSQYYILTTATCQWELDTLSLELHLLDTDDVESVVAICREKFDGIQKSGQEYFPFIRVRVVVLCVNRNVDLSFDCNVCVVLCWRRTVSTNCLMTMPMSRR